MAWAIRSVCDSLYRRHEDNKVLIILSDGKPNDVRLQANGANAFRGVLTYSGGIAVADTAKEVHVPASLVFQCSAFLRGTSRLMRKSISMEKILFSPEISIISQRL